MSIFRDHQAYHEGYADGLRAGEKRLQKALAYWASNSKRFISVTHADWYIPYTSLKDWLASRAKRGQKVFEIDAKCRLEALKRKEDKSSNTNAQQNSPS